MIFQNVLLSLNVPMDGLLNFGPQKFLESGYGPLLKKVGRQWSSDKFQKRGVGRHNFHIFLSVFFFGLTKLKLIEKQEKF